MGTLARQGKSLFNAILTNTLTASLSLVAPLGLASAPALAAEPAAEPGAPALPGGDAPDLEEADSGPPLDPLQEQLRELNERLKAMEDQQTAKATGSRLSINGYVDFGFFAPIGNRGVGFREDRGNLQYPQYGELGANPYSWTFVGDILATAVNSRGEVASLGGPSDTPGLVVPRFDSVNSGGAAGFIANELNMRLGYALTDRALMHASVNFVPRTGSDFALGDFMDVDIAEMEYVPTDSGNTSIFVGKIMPVFGIEYKDRKSDQRFGVTPSLIQRYTSGSQLGVKVRSKLLNGWLIAAGSVTNNSSTTEQFHFYSEVDKNVGKTLNGRLAVSIPIGDYIAPLSGHHLELGVSGEWGPQDRATDDGGKIWFEGLDLQYLSANFMLKAQAIRGHAPGTANGDAWHLDLHPSGYVEIDYQAFGQLGFMGRAEMRDAFVALAMTRAYVTKEMRFTGGVRFLFSPHIVLKAEYLYNREFGATTQFRNDVFTSSLVLGF